MYALQSFSFKGNVANIITESDIRLKSLGDERSSVTRFVILSPKNVERGPWSADLGKTKAGSDNDTMTPRIPLMLI